MSKLYDQFINLYPLSKTLRFELKPQGKTLENMKAHHIIEDDERKAEYYKKAKSMIDEYHKKFIEDCMSNFSIDVDVLREYKDLIKCQKNSNREDRLKIESNMRKSISDKFTKNETYKDIFSKKIITEILPVFESDKVDTSVLDEFSQFYTYFKGFNENRKNMYVADDKSTAISYRLINENLPMFIDNIDKFNYIYSILSEDEIRAIEDDLREILQVENIEDMFTLEYYNDVLTQRGIDVYNHIIGGYSEKDGVKIKGLNEHINEYRQKHPDNKISKLNMLYKQMLAESESASFVYESIENDSNLIRLLQEFSVKFNENIIEKDFNLEQLLKQMDQYDMGKIYVKNDSSMTDISQSLYGDWSILSDSIKSAYDKEFGVPDSERKEEDKKKYLKSRQNITIEDMNSYAKDVEGFRPLESYFKNCGATKTAEKNIFEIYKSSYESLNYFISSIGEDSKLKSDTDGIRIIKEYLDSIKSIQLFIKPLVAVRFDLDKEKDTEFYDKLLGFWDDMMDLDSVYNKTRNYLTGKPYSTDKIKLNFNSPTLLDGWALGNEIANSGLIFRKNGLYYLGIINKKYNSTFKSYESPKNNNDVIEKMEYLQAADPQKDVQNLMRIDGKTVKKNGKKDKNDGENRRLEELKNKYLPEEINRIRKEKSYSKTSEKFSKNDLIKFIDFYKERTCEYFDKFKFEFKDSSEYKDFGEFTSDINNQAYQISFKEVSYEYISNLVEDGKLYLFQIYNKDFSEQKRSQGTPNLHTLYWKALFSEENLKDVVYKLNGEAEIFYRKSSIEKKITHPKNVKIKNKNPLNKNKESQFDYDLIKDKRFSEDKFLFHVPIALNFKASGISNINEQVNLALKNSDDNYVIGIDRGERHLLYLTLIDSKGKIVEQYTLNTIKNEINGSEHETDYHNLLDYKEKEREKARESWQSIENIKNLKEGYLSQAINKITDLMIKYNAIVVLEDLNFGFMKGRQKFEKQVYQKFEKMLIDKLNYMVKKNIDANSPGGLMNAYQLTNEFESFKKLKKQSGFLYYIPAWNTSKMDPVTGFVNLFYVKYINETKAKEFFGNIDFIRYNSKRGYFEFDIDYKKFGNRAGKSKNKWTLCTYGNRIKTYRNPNKNNEWDSEEVDLTSEFKQLFSDNGIDINEKDLKNQILEQQGKLFWCSLINLFKLMLQMRNSITGTEIDYIISPVANEEGEFYDSRAGKEDLPKDADANGAYNIARKGLWIIKQIKNTTDDKMKNIKLAITNEEWLKFIQNKEYDV